MTRYAKKHRSQRLKPAAPRLSGLFAAMAPTASYLAGMATRL